jgi:hypothetical protein
MNKDLEKKIRESIEKVMMSKKTQLREAESDFQFVRTFLDYAYSGEQEYLNKFQMLIKLEQAKKELIDNINNGK